MREQAGAVIEIGVVAVDRVSRSAVGDADRAGLRGRCAEGGSVAQCRVEAALDDIVLKLHRMGCDGRCSNCGQCQAAHYGESAINSGDWVAHRSGGV